MAHWDKEIQKKDEIVDRVGGRIWTSKSDLLSEKIVCGVIRA